MQNPINDLSEKIEIKEIKESYKPAQIQLTEKPILRLLKKPVFLENINTKNNSNIDLGKATNKELEYNSDIDEEITLVNVSGSDLEITKNTILSYKDGDICPSIKALMQLTGLPKNTIHSAKKQLEIDGFIKTEGNKTLVMGV